MPDLATTEGSDIAVVRWLVGVGETVQRGQALLEVETDKATMEVESVASGVLKAIHAAPKEKVAVGAHIATVEVAQ